MKLLENITVVFFGGLFLLTIGTIGVCLAVMVLSMTVECVTGFDLIRQVIRPIFGH